MSSTQPVSSLSAPTDSDTSLSRTIDDLRVRLEAQRLALNQLRASLAKTTSQSSSGLPSELQEIQNLKAAYTSATLSPPYLPPKDSPLPALLALRQTHETIRSSKSSTTTEQTELSRLQSQLSTTRSQLQDTKLLNTALEVRTASLTTDIGNKQVKTPAQVGDEIIQKLRARKEKYDADTEGLTEAFNEFIETRLGKMLVLEERGGGVVGSVTIDSDDDSEEERQAPRKKVRISGMQQRRINDMFRNEDGSGRNGNEERAIEELRSLVERLMNALVESGGGEGAWLEIREESVAVRYLVRSRLALLHPRSEKRLLRLVDFGKEIGN